MQQAPVTIGRPGQVGEKAWFGVYSLDFAARSLKAGEATIAIGSRALDLLIALLRQPGAVVGKGDLLSEVWPDTLVEESNLRVHVAALRKTLRDGEAGNRFIVTIPGRGYCFVAPVSRSSSVPRPSLLNLTSSIAHLLPGRRTNVIGRSEVVDTVVSQLTAHQIVTIIGAGGVGKTTVAIAVAYAMLQKFSDAVYFVDLGSVSDPMLMASSVATPLGLTITSDDPIASLVNLLGDRRILLILDCCEHLIDPVAALVEALMRGAPQVSLLVTSREILRVQAESVYRLQPLDTPPDEPGLTTKQVMAFSAVQLFVARLEESGSAVRLNDEVAPLVADICRKLDGVALAIELAAGRVGAFGVTETAKMLDGRSMLHWPGRRTAPPRHQTLQATLDWSYNLLPPCERLMLCRLSVFVAPFPLAAVEAVMVGQDTSLVLNSLAELVSKSLVTSETISGTRYHRLLDTTRAYADQQFASSLERAGNNRRFAEFYADFLQGIGPLPPALSNTEIYARFAVHIGNVRSALRWAFGPHGDLFVAVRLAAGAMRLLTGLSLLAECRDWARLAIDALDDATLGTQYELELQSSLAEAMMLTEGSNDGVRTAFHRALRIAKIIGDQAYQHKLLVGLNSFHIRIGECRPALDFALRSFATAQEIGEPGRIAGARICVGIALNMTGDLSGADHHFRAALEYAESAKTTHSDISYRITAQGFPARNSWLRGYPDRAIVFSKKAMAKAATLRQPAQTCVILAWLIWVDLWTGDWRCADADIRELHGQATRHGLLPYQHLAAGLLAELMIRSGDTVAGVSAARHALTRLDASGYRMHTSPLSCALTEGLGMIGQTEAALETIRSLIDEVGIRGDLFIMPELLRVRGTLLAAQGVEGPGGPELWFTQSLAVARAQGARSWELKTATSFAHFLLQSGRPKEAEFHLAPVFQWFTEGFATSDLQAARYALEQIALVLPRA